MKRTRTRRRRWPIGHGAERAHRGARRGLAFLLVAIALVFAQGSRLGHMLLIQHSVCEHGDLVEGAHHAEDASASPHERNEADVRGVGSDQDRNHDHCDAASILHRVDLTTSAIAGASLLYVEPKSGSERAEVRAVAPIDLAPKASPPRV